MGPLEDRLKFPIAVLLAAGLLSAQTNEKPLTALPDTPSLDIPAMDKSVSACVDFYHYSCGGWIKSNPIPADQARWDVYSKLQDDNQRFLWGLLEQAAKPDPNRTPVQREIGDFFYSCMDEATVNRLGSTPLNPDLRRISDLKSTRDLAAYLGRTHLTAGDVIFPFASNQDFENSDSVIGFADAGGLGLPDRDYYTKTDAKSEETRKKYVEHVARMLQLIGESAQAAAADAKVVMEIETAMAKATLTRVETRDPYKLFHKMTPAQLQALTPAFRWNDYLETRGAPQMSVFNVTQPEFYKALSVLFQTRSLNDWKAYLRWHLVHAEAAYLSQPFVQANFDFYNKHLRGVEQMRPRWKRCVALVDGELGEALGQVFVEKTFPPDMKAKTLAMTKEIESAMQSEIEQLPWMSAVTKQKALEKLHGVVNKIGYPDHWRDYSSIKITREDFLANVQGADMFEARRDMAKIGKPVDRGEWGMTPPTVNAYYNGQMNDIDRKSVV